jgi:hypothetical protein
MGALAGRIKGAAGPLGVVCLLAAVVWGAMIGDRMERFFHSYLWSFAYFLSIAVGALFFVILQHLVKATWSVTVRRIAEILSSTFPVLFVLFLVILAPMLLESTALYPWTNAELVESDYILSKKAGYLNVPWFAFRMVLYFAVWSALARYFFKRSVAQDLSGDPALSDRMRWVSGPAMIAFAVATTWASFDLLMSLDPHWFSTIYGVYFFAGSAIAIMSALILIPLALQASGRIKRAVTVEHYHDLGKLLFGFVFFWGYIAFSQFMLIWYANIPEETEYFRHRMELGDGYLGWGWIGLALLLLHFAFPFVCLLSRWTKRLSVPIGKRRIPILALFAIFMLAMHWVDMYWLVMPSYSTHKLVLHPIDLLNFLGIGGLFVASAAHAAGKVHLLPIKDPKLGESLRFQNL